MPASEQDFLASIDRHFPNATPQDAPGITLGRGDDCAIIEQTGPLCLSTDLFVEHAHFRRSYFAPQDIGHKALAAAASDLAAMGAAPVGFALSLILPAAAPSAAGPAAMDDVVNDVVDDAFLDALLSGMAALSARLALPLIGGDLSGGPTLALDITVLGRPGASGRLLRRCMAQPGDALVVIGPFGLARAGLLALESAGRTARETWPAATNAHLRPEPRLSDGQALASHPAVRGLMDVSDGLARDLPRFLGADAARNAAPLGADLAIDEAMLHPETVRFFHGQGLDPVAEAVLGGEDYALLAAVDPAGLAAVLAALPDTLTDTLTDTLPGALVIGSVAATPGLRLNGRPFTKAGFDHFG